MSQNEERRERRRYLTGALLSALLTALAFLAVMTPVAGRAATLGIVAVAAIVQIIVQLRYFLHIGFGGQKREDLQLILFSLLMLAMMAGGAIWIMTNLAGRMH